MRTITKLLIGIVGFLILVGIFIQIDNKIEINQLRQNTNNQNINANIQRILYKVNNLQTKDEDISAQMNSDYLELNTKIVDLPAQERQKKLALEKKLKEVTVFIFNKTAGSLGSGTIIKYKEKFYILTAGHLCENGQEVLSYGVDGKELGLLEIVKQDYTLPEDDNNKNYTTKNDLLLLKLKYGYFNPDNYVELAEKEMDISNEIYIVGNPMGIEDVVSDGRIIQYVDNYMYYINHTYFGNSGGGVFTRDGKLIGVVSHIRPLFAMIGIPPSMTYGASRLLVIQKFLEGVE